MHSEMDSEITMQSYFIRGGKKDKDIADFRVKHRRINFENRFKKGKREIPPFFSCAVAKKKNGNCRRESKNRKKCAEKYL